MEKQAFEPTGLIPRSIIRTVDRFVQQLLPGREKIALQEYRVSRYQILVSIKSLLTLFLIPILVSSTMKALLFTPLVEYFWNKNQSEIFLNQYQEKRAFSEMHDFSEKMFFESLLIDNKNKSKSSPRTQFESENFDSKSIANLKTDVLSTKSLASAYKADRMRDGLCKKVKVEGLQSPSRMRSALYASHLREIFFEDPTAKMHVVQAIDLGRCSGENDASEDIIKNDASIDRLYHVKHLASSRTAFACLATQGMSEDEVRDASHNAKEELPKEIIKFVTDVENEKYQILFQKKSLELAKSYNKQSILAITNLLGDFFTFFTLFVLFQIMRPELIILKSFLTESVYSLSDTTKSFLLILGMDLLVGFHSPRGWELLLEGFLRHIGLPENENFILLFVALFPVFLDTVFKYWIFRYLNKISPSTVVTYHSMIE